MVSINTLFRLKPIKAVVVGDLFLDQYLYGKAGRVSPEAPVLVHQVDEECSFPGGAGNVALNLVHFGAKVTFIARVGSDSIGDLTRKKLEKEDINTDLLLSQEEYKTPRKIRVLSDGKQLLRIDNEKIIPPSVSIKEEVLEKIEDLDCDIILLSDYGKGFLTDEIIRAVIDFALKKGVKVLVDPKGVDYKKYRGAYLIKPNEKEAYLASKLDSSRELNEVAKVLQKELDVESLLITRSSKGMALYSRDLKRRDFLVKKKDVVDVTGAGDTVLASLAFSLANKIDLSEALELANFTACMTLDYVGCASLTMSDIARRLFELNKYDKVIDSPECLWFITRLASELPIKLIKIEQMNDQHLFSLIECLDHSSQVIYGVYISPQIDRSWIKVLSSLKGVGFILTQEKYLLKLLKEILIFPNSSNLTPIHL